MKTSIKIFVIAMCLFAFNAVSAQTAQKFGHIESNKLMAIMPEMKAAQADLQKKATEFETQIKSMRGEYEKLIQAYQAGEKTMSDIVKQAKIKEIQDAEQRIQLFSQHAQQTLQKSKEEMIKPVIEKANNAIKAVGSEQGFIYIFDLSAGNILFHSSKSVDVFPLVKKKLGIQ